MTQSLYAQTRAHPCTDVLAPGQEVFAHQALQHAALAAALTPYDCNLRQVHRPGTLWEPALVYDDGPTTAVNIAEWGSLTVIDDSCWSMKKTDVGFDMLLYFVQFLLKCLDARQWGPDGESAVAAAARVATRLAAITTSTMKCVQFWLACVDWFPSVLLHSLRKDVL